MARYHFNGFEFHEDQELLLFEGAEIRIRPKTAELLAFFLKHSDQLLSKQDLLAAIWPNIHVSEAVLFQTISDLRKILNNQSTEGPFINNLKKKGYRFCKSVLCENADTEPLSANLTIQEEPSGTNTDPSSNQIPISEQPEPKEKATATTSRWWMTAAIIFGLGIGAWFLFPQLTAKRTHTEPKPFSIVLLSTQAFHESSPDDLLVSMFLDMATVQINHRHRLSVHPNWDSRQLLGGASVQALDNPSYVSNLCNRLGVDALVLTHLEIEEAISLHYRLYGDGLLLQDKSITKAELWDAAEWLSQRLNHFAETREGIFEMVAHMVDTPALIELYGRALLAYQSNQFENALALLHQARSVAPKEPFGCILRARNLLELGRLKEAEQLTMAAAGSSIRLQFEKVTNRGKLSLYRGDLLTTKQLETEALMLAQKLEDPLIQAWAYRNLGSTLSRLGHLDEAELAFRSGLTIYQQEGKSEGLPGAFQNLGNVLYSRAKYQPAVDHYRQASLLYLEQGEPCRAAGAMANMGVAFDKLGQRAESKKALQDALKLARNSDTDIEIRGLISMGNYYFVGEQFAAAAPYYQQAIEKAQHLAHQDLEYNASFNLASAYFQTGNLEEAESLADRCLKKNGYLHGDVLLLAAKIAYQQGAQLDADKLAQLAKNRKGDRWETEEEQVLQSLKKGTFRRP